MYDELGPLYDREAIARATYWLEQYGTLSAPFLQRRLHISYQKALEIIKEAKQELEKNLVLDL